ncbi:MAG: InlB B-repeat-containing protein [Treponema sp.]
MTFSVEGGNGTLKAKAEGIVGETENSPISIEQGKTITFMATPSTNYQVKEWKVDGTVVPNNKTNTYTHTVTKAVNITVSFEDASTPQPKYEITFSVEGSGGNLTAIVDGRINSGSMIEKGKIITFNATPNDGYKIKEWKVDDVVTSNKEETYVHTVTQAVNVKVSFEPIKLEKATLTLEPSQHTFKIKAVTSDGSPIMVEGCTASTLESNVETKLTATVPTVILKGVNIIRLVCRGDFFSNKHPLTSIDVQGLTNLNMLNCSNSQLTSLNVKDLTTLNTLDCSNSQLTTLNVSGCTALKTLYCSRNQLNDKAMTELLNALPARVAGDYAKAILYAELGTEGNYKDFTTPSELKTAFDAAKAKHWGLQKQNTSGHLKTFKIISRS